VHKKKLRNDRQVQPDRRIAETPSTPIVRNFLILMNQNMGNPGLPVGKIDKPFYICRPLKNDVFNAQVVKLVDMLL
jgi:hypothetical protein